MIASYLTRADKGEDKEMTMQNNRQQLSHESRPTLYKASALSNAIVGPFELQRLSVK